MKRKLFCVWMCIAMIVTLMPSMAFAKETSASPEVQATSTSNAIAGSIAVVSWDENGQESYDTSGATMQVYPGASTEYCAFGTGTGDAFQPMEASPDTCTISVQKDSWENVQTKNDSSYADPLYEGAFLGWYDSEEGAVYLGYNQNAVLLGTETYGEYHISITWTQNEKTYEASTTLTLQKADSLVRGFFSNFPEDYDRENGFSRSWYTWSILDQNTEGQYQLDYEPYYDYQESYTVLYADGEHGILNYVRSDCNVDGLFTLGEAVAYKEGLEITPLQIDYSKLTAEMIDQSYTLTFSSTTGQTVTCNVVVTKRNQLEELVDGQVYLVRDGIVKEDGRLYISNQDESVQDLVKSEFVDRIKREMEITRYHFGIWNKTNSSFTPVGISCDDAAVTISGSKEQGYELYAEQETTGTFVTTDGIHIRYTFSLPEAGFYRMPARTSENYLGDEIYLAEEMVTDGHYRFYYMVQAKNPFQKEELDVTHRQMEGVTVSTADDWTDSVNNQTYYVWEVQVDSQATFDEEFRMSVSGKKDGQEFDANDWLTIYDINAVPESQQLYWLSDNWNVNAMDDGKLQLQDDANGSLDGYANRQENWAGKNGSISGYFAVKKGDDFYALKNVQLTETEGMALTVSDPEADPFLYTISWMNFGTYHFAAETEGKEYRFVFNATLPDVGFYSTDIRSEEKCIGNEFHYIDAVEKNADSTEAYFYLIAPTYNYSLNQISVSFGRWLSEEETEDLVWAAKKVFGMEIGTPQMAAFDNEKYAVWKITVSDAYQNPYGNWQELRIIYGSGTEERNTGLHVFSSTEIPEKEQLYWFYYSSAIDVDENGKMSLSSDSTGSLADRAAVRTSYSNKSDSHEGYFAVKKDGEYYALQTVQTSETEGISLNASADIPYLYKVEWSKFGEYLITATDDNETKYRMNFSVILPEIGFYSTATRNEGTYIGNEFHYIDAVEKNANNTEAYFYLIAPTYDYSLNKISASFGEWLIQGETDDTGDDDNVWVEKEISGVKIETPQIGTFGNEEYAVWKITVSDSYQNPYNDEQYLRTIYGGGANTGGMWCCIYDSTEISEEEQLYWFYDSSAINIDESGKIRLSSDSTGSLDDSVHTQFNWNGKSGSMEGYFAVKKDGEYYALRTVRTSKTEGISLTEYADTPYLYRLEWSEFGEYHITATDNEIEYRLNFNVELPEIGCYSKPARTKDFYIDSEFHFVNAMERNEAGTEAYFYLIAPTNGYDLSQVQPTIVYNTWDADASQWIQNKVSGIVLGRD